MINSLKKLPNFPILTAIIAAICIAIQTFSGTDSTVILERMNVLDNWILLPIYFVATNVFHLGWAHLGLNLFLWAVFASRYESRHGPLKLAILIVCASLLGGIVETIISNVRFAGLSISIFALLAAFIVDELLEQPQFLEKSRFFTCAIAGVLVFLIIGIEAAIAFAGSYPSAVGAHVGGAMAGLFSKLGLGGSSTQSRNGMPFRAMQPQDVGPVLDIIFDFDEDDGEEAEESFERSLANKYVVEIDGRIAGMTGFTIDDHGPGIAWLSWTYVHKDFQRQGIAFEMMQEVRHKLDKAGIRKVFIATSDYICEDTGKDIYKPARHFYENKLNATREIVVKDYYSPGESKYVYSLPVREPVGSPVQQLQGIYPLFIDLLEADESEGGYVIGWDESDDAIDQTSTLMSLVEEARQKNGHAVFVTMPSGLSANGASYLTAAGFRQVGRITDYYAFGVDDTYWAYYMSGD